MKVVVAYVGKIIPWILGAAGEGGVVDQIMVVRMLRILRFVRALRVVKQLLGENFSSQAPLVVGAGHSWKFVSLPGVPQKKRLRIFRIRNLFRTSEKPIPKIQKAWNLNIFILQTGLADTSRSYESFKRRFGTVWKLIRGLLTSFDAPGRCEKERLRKNLLGKFRKTEKKFRKKLQNKQTELGVSVWAIATFLKYLAFCKPVW